MKPEAEGETAAPISAHVARRAPARSVGTPLDCAVPPNRSHGSIVSPPLYDTNRLRRASLWHRIWQLPDIIALQSGARGELLVAKARIIFTGLVLLVPVKGVFTSEYPRANLVGLGSALAAALLAAAVYQVVKHDLYRPWLSVATASLDVSLVSAALAAFMIMVDPHAAVNSRTTFEVYFLAIGATSLRHDVRLCLLAGLLAIIQYAAIVAYAATQFPLNDPVFAPFKFGTFSWPGQVSRVILLFVATLLSAAIVIRVQQLLRLSATDRLTGLFNRGHFDERLEAELSRAQRKDEPLSLVIVDIDHFKEFNDRHGHSAGDAALRAIARQIRQMIRRSDVIGRFGGEEFVVLMPETAAESAIEKVEAMRRAVEEAPIELPRSEASGAVTVSAGVATFPADGSSVEALFEEADARLFRAKESGRNCVVGGAAVTSLP